MNFSRKQTIGENLLYFLIWLVMLIVPVLNSEMVEGSRVLWDDMVTAWRKLAPYLILFLLHNIVIAPRLLFKRRYVAYFVVNIITIVLIFTVVDVYERYLAEKLLSAGGAEKIIEYRQASFTDLALYWNVLLGLFMTGMNSSIKFMYKSISDEQKMEILKRQNLQAEMDSLRYQINPHFFMNTLNNIHALIDIDAEMAKRSVIELSRMMRYVLYDSTSMGNVSLRKDIAFIENYIQLMRIRYEDVDIRFDYPHDIPPKIAVPPLLFIVFVENAFKHGISYTTRSFIDITIELLPQHVRFAVANSRHPEPINHKCGIGLMNARKRMELIYDDRFKMRVDTSRKDVYGVELIIPLLHD